MAPLRGRETLLELCDSTVTLGNTIAKHTLEYLSIARTPRHGFKALATEFLEASRPLFPAKAGLCRSNAKFSTDITYELRDRFNQTRDAFNVLDDMVQKLLSGERKKLLKFRMMFADADIERLRISLAQCRAAMSVSTLMFSSSFTASKEDAAAGVSYTALAAVLGCADPTRPRTKDSPPQSPAESAMAELSPDRRPLPPTPSSNKRGHRLAELRTSGTPQNPRLQPPASPAPSNRSSAKSQAPSQHSSVNGGGPDNASDATDITSPILSSFRTSANSTESKVPKQAIRVKPDSMTAPMRKPHHNTGKVLDVSKQALTEAVWRKEHRAIEDLLEHAVPPEYSHLVAAINNGDVHTVRLLLAFGCDIQPKEKDRLTPLYLVTKASFFEAAKLLVEYGADPNVPSGPYGETPFTMSLASTKLHFCQLYLRYNADADAQLGNGETPLTQAMSRTASVNLVELLLVYGDPNGKNSHGETPLFKAVNAERADLVNLALQHGADPNMPGPKIVLWPAVHHPPILETLLKNGSDLRRAPGVLELATSTNCRKAIDLLLQHGADPNAKKDGIYTPLCSAIRDNREELVDLLLASGADPNLTALEVPAFKCVTYHRKHLLPRIIKAGADPNKPKGIVEHAVHHNDKDVLIYLLEQGCDPNARNLVGNTALTTAIREKRMDMIDILLSYNASPAVHGKDWPISMAVHHPEILAKLLPHIQTSMINKGAVEMAVVANKLDSVKALLAHGVSVEEKTGGVFSPLTTSIRENRKDIFRHLVDEAGADPNAPGEHLPIIKAIRRHREDDMSYIEHLLVKGADINLMYRGWNAVLQALDNGDLQILRLLARKGSPDLEARDEGGRSVREIMEERGLEEEMRILISGESPSP